MFVAYVQHPHGTVTDMQVLGSNEPIPHKMFAEVGRKQGRSLWCHYLVGNDKVERWCRWDVKTDSWWPTNPPATLKLAVTVAS